MADDAKASLSHEQRDTILENVQDGILAVNDAGNIMYMNGAARRLYGFEERFGLELESVNLRQYALDAFEEFTLAGDPVPDEERPLIRALQGESLRDVELVVRHVDRDESRVFVVSSDAIEGDVPIHVLTIRDETDRWRAHRRFRVSFETDPAPSVVARLEDAEILLVNEGMIEMTGREQHELEGSTLTELELLSHNGDLLKALSHLRAGHRLHKHKTSVRNSRGRELDVLVSARAIELEGDACGIFTFVDITDLERTRREHIDAQEELNLARSRLAQQREDERARMARDLHDGLLQNLLAFNTELANDETAHRNGERDEAADLTRRYREKTLGHAKALRRAIRGFRPGAVRELGLWVSVRDTLPDLDPASGPELILPLVEPPDGIPERTMVAIYRVSQEAIRNALKHAEASRIHVMLDALDHELLLQVTDDGKGFEVPARLSTFEQEDHFGLIGMDERAAVQGGTLEVESAPGRGTTIRFRVPMGPEGQSATR